MRNRKILLYVLIPLIIVVLILIAGVVFLKLNSTPEKIFKNSISKVFEMFETTEEQFSTMKGTMNLSANVESDSQEMQIVNSMLEGTSVGLNMGVDTTNMIVNENLNVTINNESLLNATILLQDQKGYVYLPEWLDKYLQVPEEDMEYSDLTEYYDKIATLDQNALMEAIKEELIVAISNQELVQEKTTLVLDGQETKVTASTLSLKGEEQTKFTREVLTKLKDNEKIQTALGAYKEEILLKINEELEYLDDKENLVNNMGNEELLNEVQDIVNNREFKLSIYTKGLLNEFVGVSAIEIDTDLEEGGIELLKHSEQKYEFVLFNEDKGEREEYLNLIIEDKKESKNKGTATITMTVDGETYTVLYNYEKQGKQTLFVLSTEIEGVGLSISGNATEYGKNVKGNFVISVQEETFGKINLNCTYDFTYDVEVQKVDVGNSVLIDELSEEDQEEFMTNFINSDLYKMIEPIATSIVNEFSLGGITQGATQNALNNLPQVTYDGHTVMYTVPEGFEMSEYSSEDFKMYMDEDFNSINVTINYDSVDTYMNDLEDEYVLTSDFYENQKISDIKSMNINGKEYKLRTLTYNDEYGTYANLYFAYELDDEYCYVVEVETENGNISMDTIKNFLNMTVTQDGLLPTDDIATTGEEIIDILQ